MIDPNNWGWPQWVEVCLIIFALITGALEHGKPRTGEHSFPVKFVGVLLAIFILTFGGFFA